MYTRILYRNVICPSCGNEITVNSGRNAMRCYLCKRVISIKFTGEGKKAKAIVDVMDDNKINSEENNNGY